MPTAKYPVQKVRFPLYRQSRQIVQAVENDYKRKGFGANDLAKLNKVRRFLRYNPRKAAVMMFGLAAVLLYELLSKTEPAYLIPEEELVPGQIRVPVFYRPSVLHVPGPWVQKNDPTDCVAGGPGAPWTPTGDLQYYHQTPATGCGQQLLPVPPYDPNQSSGFNPPGGAPQWFADHHNLWGTTLSTWVSSASSPGWIYSQHRWYFAPADEPFSPEMAPVMLQQPVLAIAPTSLLRTLDPGTLLPLVWSPEPKPVPYWMIPTLPPTPYREKPLKVVTLPTEDFYIPPSQLRLLVPTRIFQAFAPPPWYAQPAASGGGVRMRYDYTPHKLEKPPKRTKEVKVVSKNKALAALLVARPIYGYVTEVRDMVRAVYQSLPPWDRLRWKNTIYMWRDPPIYSMLQGIISNADRLQGGDYINPQTGRMEYGLITNFFRAELKDQVIGKLGSGAQKSYRESQLTAGKMSGNQSYAAGLRLPRF